MNLMNDSKVRKLIEDAQDQGFVLSRGENSFKLTPPDKTKPIVVISSTPSDNNIYWELRRQLRKSGMVVK
jgi:hypothetical protein